ncbi:ankyrin repeat-containing domain protein [Xylariales sp. AK1849]|nr:ankyrin repeat-containing domain protein [Xylariales sp. AK1849]
MANWLGDTGIAAQISEMVTLLVDRGASVSLKDDGGCTALERLCRYRLWPQSRAVAAQKLLENGADPNCQSTDTKLLELTFRDDDLETCDILLQYSAEQPTEVECKSIFEDCLLYTDKCIDERLKTGSWYFFNKFHNSRSIIRAQRGVLQALRNKDTRLAISLIRAGAPIDHCAEDLRSCLGWACRIGDLEVAEKLLARGAAVDDGGRSGETPLLLATQLADLDLIQLLLDHNATVNQPSCIGDTSLSVAVSNDNVEAVRLLLKYGALGSLEGDLKSDCIARTLDATFKLNTTTIFDLMVSSGLLSYVTATHQAKLLHKACTHALNGRSGFLKEALAAGFDPNIQSAIYNGTYLQYVAEQLRSDLVSLLVQGGADIYLLASVDDLTTKGLGTSALEWSILHSNKEIVSTMLIWQPLESRSACEISYYIHITLAAADHSLISVLMESADIDSTYQNNNGDNLLMQLYGSRKHVQSSGEAKKQAHAFLACLQVLLEMGCNLNANNHAQKHALDAYQKLASYDGPDDFYKELSYFMDFGETGIRLTGFQSITREMSEDELF